MTGGEYALGLLIFAGTAGMSACAAVLVLRRWCPDLTGSTWFVAVSVLFTGGLLLVHIVPGALGLLTRWTALAGAALVLLAVSGAALLKLNPGSPPQPTPPLAPDRPGSLAIGVAGVGAVGLGVGAYLRETFAVSVVHSDTLNYHFAVVADWIANRSLWKVVQFEPGLAAGNYPQNGDIVILAVVMPWGQDAFARFAVLPYLAVAGVVVYALCRELAVPRSTGLLAAALLTSTYTVMYPSVAVCVPDAIAGAMLGAGALFLLRHLRVGNVRELVLAGIALGIAFGAKWYAVPAVGVLVAVWAGALLVRRREFRPVAVQVLWVGLLVTAFGGFWLLRNWVESGSPVFPTGGKVFGVSLFDVPYDYVAARFDHRVSEYLFDPRVWQDALLPAYRTSLGLTGAALIIGVPLGIARVVRIRRTGAGARQSLTAVAVLSVAVVILVLVYIKTPYSALGEAGAPVLIKQNTRYLLPALMLAVPLLAWAVQILGRFRPAAEVALLIAVCDGLQRSLDPGRAAIAQVLLAVGAIATITVAVRRLVNSGRVPVPRRALAGGACAALLVLVAGGWFVQRRAADQRFQSNDPAIDWVNRHAPTRTKIGLAGTNAFDGTPPAYPMYGPTFGNDVSYVGPHVKGGLRRYRRSDGFRHALREGNYDLLVVGRANQFDERGTHPLRWARDAGFTPVTRSPSLTLLRPPTKASRK